MEHIPLDFAGGIALVIILIKYVKDIILKLKNGKNDSWQYDVLAELRLINENMKSILKTNNELFQSHLQLHAKMDVAMTKQEQMQSDITHLIRQGE